MSPDVPPRQRRSTAPFQTGTMFADRFRIERILGAGGMGTIYEATDTATNDRVALKVLPRDKDPDQETLERFRREGAILAALDHPTIVDVRAVGQSSEGAPWIAMELLEGETLEQRVRRTGPQSPQTLVPIVDAVCDGLEVAHARGVIHRDLKPGNIFIPVTGSPAAMILDFGLSALAGDKKLTRTGAVLGTPRYMAPEQIRSIREADGRADIYALGVIVYEALAGKSPFTASDRGQLLGAILTGRIESLADVRPDVPPEVEQALRKAMAPREERYPMPGAFAYAFAKACGMPSHRPPPELGELDHPIEDPTPLGAEPLAPDAFGARRAHDPRLDGRPRFSVPPEEVAARVAPNVSAAGPSSVPAPRPPASTKTAVVAVSIAIVAALVVLGAAIAVWMLR